MSKIKVVELFAGVGGFRVGLERTSTIFETIYANQWEPSTKVQHAYDVYDAHFPDSNNVNDDIAKVWDEVPAHDMLVGGFPCQDYSVAQGNRAKGINGKKGVLWWEMYKIISKRKPKRILLENVDRLLNSPTSQRGRDFAIMIYSLNLIGYIVEWKVIKASDYGFPQKRKRVFIYAYRSKRKTNPSIKDISSNSIFELAFPSTNVGDITTKDISTLGDLSDITEKYDGGKFLDRGIAINGVILQTKQLPVFEGYLNTLNDIKDGKSKGYVYLNDDQIKRAAYMKASKKIPRIDKNTGFTYNYSEGRMDFPDSLQKPGRTMLTSEGTINRSTHFIKAGNKVRLITPLEAERMNGFPDGWTKTQPDRRRLFMMGNALVTGIVDKLAQEIQKKEGK